MTNQIITIALMAILMLGVLAPFALAEEVVTDATVEIVTTSNVDTSAETELELDQEVTNGQIFWKQTRLWFAFNQETKANGELELAKMRLAQANWAAKNNNPELVEKALEAHEKLMNRVQERVKSIEYNVDNKNVTVPVARLVALENSIAVHEQRIEFLNNVLAGTELTDAQRTRIEARISKVEEVTTNLQEANDAKRERLVTRIMAVTDMTEEEANDAIVAREATIRENIKERLQNRILINSEDTEEVETEVEVQSETQTQAEKA
ncbi:MAG: hypothetical protein Q8L27_00330 [archaeon]|nr:hypothetical protein [archaeon]